MGASQQVGYRQGIVLSWDPETAENTIIVGGTTLVDIPILNTSEALLLTPGSVVGLLTVGPSWVILGRLTIPGTPDAASALGIITDRLVSVDVTASEVTTSTLFHNLATVGPQATGVTVGQSGKALVIVSASLAVSATRIGDMGVDVSGPTNVSPSVGKALTLSAGATDAEAISASRVLLFTSLIPGSYEFTAKYRHTTAAVTFSERNLTVMPF